MRATVPAIHSSTAPPLPPPRPQAPAPAPRGCRRTTTSPLREASQPQSPPPSLSSRRAALLLLLVAASPPRPAAAAATFSLGIPGPKELLREQKKKSARFLLAPIAASREGLLKARTLLTSGNAASEDAEEVRRLLGVAARDCVPRQRNSLVALQSKTGVEVCTFSLVLKNAASLLADKDPVKVDAEARLGELIESFSNLGITMEISNFELESDREKMKDDLLGAISALDKFEKSVKDCLGL